MKSFGDEEPKTQKTPKPRAKRTVKSKEQPQGDPSDWSVDEVERLLDEAGVQKFSYDEMQTNLSHGLGYQHKRRDLGGFQSME